jgi:hypothetical protein
MKTRFNINEEIFIGFNTIGDCYKYYEKHFKEHGFVLDKENEDVYKEFNKEIKLNEGDRVEFYGIRKVDWKCYNIEEDYIEYALIEE